MAQYPPQYHYGQFLGFKLDKEDAPGLAGIQRAKLVDLVDFCRVLHLDAKFSRRVFKRQFIKAIFLQRPAEFVFQIADELGEALNGAKGFDGLGHGSFLKGFLVSTLERQRQRRSGPCPR